jgi:hypothetical protein
MANPVGHTDVSNNSAILNVVTPNQAVNTQTATGVVNQAPTGGINNNYQINNASNATYGFGPGITCPTPSLSMGLFGGGSNGYASSYNSGVFGYGASLSFNIPIGGRIGDACTGLAEEIARQRQLDTGINLIKQCAELRRAGIKVDYSVFPQFEVCEGVLVTNGNNEVIPPPAPVFTPPPTAIPTVPVR